MQKAERCLKSQKGSDMHLEYNSLSDWANQNQKSSGGGQCPECNTKSSHKDHKSSRKSYNKLMSKSKGDDKSHLYRL